MRERQREAVRIATECVCCGSCELSSRPAIIAPFVAERISLAETDCNSLRCAECGALFLDVRFDDAQMGALYTGYRGREYMEQRGRHEPGYAERNADLLAGRDYLPEVERFLLRHMPGPLAVLDWGGGDGRNTPFRSSAAHRGASAPALHIYDIDEESSPLAGVCRIAKPLPQGPYDLIVCSHVLEHVPHPADVLREIAAVMTGDTVLYVELPAADTAAPRMKWHEHVNCFTPKALRILLARCGLAIIGFRELRRQRAVLLACRVSITAI